MFHHQIGRVGRLGKRGAAILLVCGDAEVRMLREVSVCRAFVRFCGVSQSLDLCVFAAVGAGDAALRSRQQFLVPQVVALVWLL
jgi:hypothetical protein